MPRMQSTQGSLVVCHGGERFDPDANGVFDVPLELARILLSHGFVEAQSDPFPIRRGRPRKVVEQVNLDAEAVSA